MNSLVIITLIIFGGGLFGGLANYHRFDTNESFNGFGFRKSLLIGLVASATMPLFLKMLSSDLLQKASEEPINYFVFAGFCLIAAFYSSRFLETIGDKVLKELEDVKKKAEDAETKAEAADNKAEENATKVDVVVDELTDSDEVEEEADSALEASVGTRSIGSATTSSVHSANHDKVMQAIANENYMFRTISGIAKECNMDKQEASKIVEDLKSEGMVVEVKNRKGQPIYALSEAGKRSI